MEDYVHRIGRTGRAGSTGQATSFYTDRDMVIYPLPNSSSHLRFLLLINLSDSSIGIQYLVAQIKKAIQDVESGNTLCFATGKVCSIFFASAFFVLFIIYSLKLSVPNKLEC